jgi:hypothetical protein
MQNIQTEVSSSTPTPAPVPVPEAPTPASTPAPAPAESFEEGGSISGDKIQWAAVGIFALTLIALGYKALYYNKAIKNLGATNNNTTKKMNELEKNIRALRGDKYETTS